MKRKTSKARRLMIVFAVAVALFALGGVSNALAVEDTQWEWTADNPKPFWWTWGDDYWPTKPVRGGYYRTAALNYIGLMNPNHWPVNDWVAMTYFYERIVFADGTYKPNFPWLAKSWRFIDPVTAVMVFRKEIQFHDGSTFNAESFKYQLEWIKDKKNGCWSLSWLEPIESLEVVDEYTLKFHFKRPWAGFLGVMQNVPGMPISAEALKKDSALKEVEKVAKRLKTAKTKVSEAQKNADKTGSPEAMSKLEKEQEKMVELESQYQKLDELTKNAISLDLHPVGTGAFILEEGRPGNYLRVKRNPNWWFGKSIGHPEMPYFDGILITIIPDPAVQLANLRAGKIDAMGIDKSQYALVKKDPELQVTVMTANHVFGFMFNHASGPLKDLRIREAVSHAIDRKALIAGTQFGLARIASCMYPEDHWAHNPSLKPVSYDPELSKKLLAEAGYSDGLTLKGIFGNTPTAQTVAAAAKDMFREVGINWEVEFLDSAAISDKMKNLDYELSGLFWSFIWDPDLMASGMYHPDGGFNYGRSNNKRAIELVEAGRSEVDVDKRQKIYWELEKVLYDNYEDAWVWWEMAVVAYNKNLQGCALQTEMFRAGREGYYASHPFWFKDGKP